MPANANTYKDDVDFQALALQFSSFAKHLKPNGQLDFSDPRAVQELTTCLLKRDFGLLVELPDDRLCPPVPNRFNYILWIQSLLDTTSDSSIDKYDPTRDVTGLDIGTGASCIYPLLGCAQRPKWRFAATDIDAQSLHSAHANISRNNLTSRIHLLKTTPESPLIPLEKLGLERLDFTICNPPFYASTEEMLTSAKGKQRPPFSACTGTATEMVSPGGEIAFTLRLLAESIQHRDKITWYTTMLGKLASVSVVIGKLKEAGIDNYAVTEFVQGTRTRRWGVAWSLAGMRPRIDIARNIPSLPRSLLPFPSTSTFKLNNTSPAIAATHLNTVLASLALEWQYRASIMTGIGFATRDVWSRAARRRRKYHRRNRPGAATDSKDQHGAEENQNEDLQDDEEEQEEEARLGFKIEVVDMEQGSEVRLRWLVGRESVLFESFCGMVRTRVAERCKE